MKPLLPMEDSEVCGRLSDWLRGSAMIVPSKCDAIAALLVQDGQSSTKRLANSLRKDEDYLLALGLDEGDSDEIVDALRREFENTPTSASS